MFFSRTKIPLIVTRKWKGVAGACIGQICLVVRCKVDYNGLNKMGIKLDISAAVWAIRRLPRGKLYLCMRISRILRTRQVHNNEDIFTHLLFFFSFFLFFFLFFPSNPFEDISFDFMVKLWRKCIDMIRLAKIFTTRISYISVFTLRPDVILHFYCHIW